MNCLKCSKKIIGGNRRFCSRECYIAYGGIFLEIKRFFMNLILQIEMAQMI